MTAAADADERCRRRIVIAIVKNERDEHGERDGGASADGGDERPLRFHRGIRARQAVVQISECVTRARSGRCDRRVAAWAAESLRWAAAQDAA